MSNHMPPGEPLGRPEPDNSFRQSATVIDRRPIWAGLTCGLAPAILAVPLFDNAASVLLMLFGMTVWPLGAVITAIIRSSRRFGLGMLLGVGLGWLVMFAICGSLNDRKPPRPRPAQNLNSAPANAPKPNFG